MGPPIVSFYFTKLATPLIVMCECELRLGKKGIGSIYEKEKWLDRRWKTICCPIS